jgi:hypothetical protein
MQRMHASSAACALIPWVSGTCFIARRGPWPLADSCALSTLRASPSLMGPTDSRATLAMGLEDARHRVSSSGAPGFPSKIVATSFIVSAQMSTPSTAQK